MLVSLVLTGVFDVGLALVAFNVAAGAGLGDQLAYVCSMIGPAIMLVITRVRSGTFGGVSIPILVFLMLSAAGSYLLAGVDPRLLIVKGAAVTGGFGLACLLSTLLPKPLMFYFGARFATDGTREGTGYWYGLWRYPDFRRSQYVVNSVWGVAFLVEAVLRILIAYTVPFVPARTITGVLPLVFLAGLLAFTVIYGHRVRRAATERLLRARAIAESP